MSKSEPAAAPALAGPFRAPDRSFRNPWPGSELPGWRAVLRMLTDRRARPRAATPRHGTFPISDPQIVYPRGGATECSATWIGHSTTLLQMAGLNILTDPVFCRRASPVQWAGPARVMDAAVAITRLPPLDVILLSHNHYDHLDKAAVGTLAHAHPSATWIVPLGLGAHISAWGAPDIVELDWWAGTVVHGLRVTATPARHFSGRSLRDRNKTLWCGFAIEAEGRRAYFAGDTAYHPDFGEISARCGPFDFVMIPIGAYDPRWFMRAVHVDPEEAVRIYQDLVAPHPGAAFPVMLAIHWGTFRLTDEPMDEPPRRAVARWHSAGLAADRLWIARFGETRAIVPAAEPR
ncbi:MAG TPA: MBL fold metallo-hydrolase [Gemmatimonadaceae bacterium]|nr:MBL fold metallo-hydrolase [Gemmatimonadaceae bacterium]